MTRWPGFGLPPARFAGERKLRVYEGHLDREVSFGELDSCARYSRVPEISFDEPKQR